jgi:predicted NBD/HSP70 family sugar kinase
MVGEVGKAKIAALEEIGEDELFEQIARGKSIRKIMAEQKIGYKLWAKWLDAKAGRRDRYASAQLEAGHYYAERAVDTAQNTDPSMVNVARLQVDTDKWMASKLNAQYDTRQRDVAINISVNDLHAQAAALLGDVIEGDAVEVDDDDV